MSTEELTADEQAVWEAMQADDGSETEPEPEPERASAEPEPEPEPEPAEASDGAEPEFKSRRAKPPEGFVPHGAFHAEREARKALEAKLAEIEKRLPQQQDKPAEPEFVDPLVDPEGFRKWDEHRISKLEAKLQAQEEARRQQEQQAQLVRRVDAAEKEFAQTTTDYRDAVAFLREQRIAELKAQAMSDQEIARQIGTDFTNIVQAAEMLGMNPAQIAYQRAQSLGWKPKAAEAEKLAAAEKAERETRSISDAGGGAQRGKMTVEQFAALSEREMARFMRENPEEARRLSGG